MYKHITEESSLLAAFTRVKRNKGCPGIDGQSIQSIEETLGVHIRELARLLNEQRYEPLPAKRVFIPKSNGKRRPLGIPAVRDRIVQQAVLDVIQPSLDATMSDSSFGFRPGRSAQQAIDAIRGHIDNGYVHVVDADIRDFFGTLDHQILMAKVREKIPDRALTKLIWKFLNAGVMEEGKLQTTTTGTPQGGVISPILANLYLDTLDKKLTGHADWKLVRYADDLVILCTSVNSALQAMRTLRAILVTLKLELAPEKTRITDAFQGFTFLGHTFWKCNDTLYTFPSDKSIASFKEKVRIHTRRQQPKNIVMVIERLNPLIRGWGNYFRNGSGKSRMLRLDEWTRMRLRSFLLKKHALSLTVHTKYPNSFFKELGLCCLSDLLIAHKT